MVDLAGSERDRDVRHHSRERFAEQKDINWSLGCLKECIRALFIRETSNPSEHIKYRNSKLTMLLKELFTSKTQRSAFVACLAPTSTHREHSKSTLSYTSALKLIEDKKAGKAPSEAELSEALIAFFTAHNPDKADPASVAAVLAKFKGREAVLYNGMSKK